MSKKIKKAADAIREEMKKPLPDHQPQEEKKMATKKKSRKKVTKKKVTKKVRKKGAAKKKVRKSKAKAAKKSVDGTTLAELAEEAGISGQKARQKLRSAGLEREKGSRWVFTNAKELKAARKALGL